MYTKVGLGGKIRVQPQFQLITSVVADEQAAYVHSAPEALQLMAGPASPYPYLHHIAPMSQGSARKCNQTDSDKQHNINNILSNDNYTQADTLSRYATIESHKCISHNYLFKWNPSQTSAYHTPRVSYL